MLLHVGRNRAGHRRLVEIAMLRQTAGGRICSTTVWHADRGITDDADRLRRLVRSRVPS